MRALVHGNRSVFEGHPERLDGDQPARFDERIDGTRTVQERRSRARLDARIKARQRSGKG